MNTQTLVVEGIDDPSTLACLARSRKYDQYRKAVDNTLKGVCPFCKIDRSYNDVIRETSLWMVWPCRPPEKNTKEHFLFVPKRHVLSICDLTTEEWLELRGHISFIRQMHNIDGSGILIRDGDATLSAGTISHLHIHLMVPDGTGRVESPFFKGAESEEEGVRRAIVFEKLRTSTKPEDLAPEEQKLVEGRL